jgi:hypothetical protein
MGTPTNILIYLMYLMMGWRLQVGKPRRRGGGFIAAAARYGL